MIDKLFERIQLPFPDNKLGIFSDGNNDYLHVLPEYYPNSCMDYGQLIKIKRGGKVVEKHKRIIYGTPQMKHIETTNIENFNGILRERIGRLVRKTKCFSKERCTLKRAVELMQFHWNMMHIIRKNETPGMMESLTDHVWKWDEFLMAHYAV